MIDEDPPAAPGEVSKGLLLALVAAQCGVMIAIGLAFWSWSGRPLGGVISVSATEAASGLGLGGALIVLGFALWKIFPQAVERLIRMQADQYRFLLPHISWPVVLAVSLCAGFGEEVLFRAGLQTFLGDHVGAPAAIVLAAAIFAAIHLAKPVVTALVFAIGCLFGAIYLHTGSLLIVALGHALYDVWALHYLHREMVRLGMVGAPAPPLVNAAERG